MTKENTMFCYQCQEAAGNIGCSGIKGVCGKDNSTSVLQDLLIYTLKGISYYANNLEVGNVVGEFVTASLFKTITNANFNDEIFMDEIEKALGIKEDLRAMAQG
jgi:hydroxylamine reductase